MITNLLTVRKFNLVPAVQILELREEVEEANEPKKLEQIKENVSRSVDLSLSFALLWLSACLSFVPIYYIVQTKRTRELSGGLRPRRTNSLLKALLEFCGAEYWLNLQVEWEYIWLFVQAVNLPKFQAVARNLPWNAWLLKCFGKLPETSITASKC